MPLNLIFIQPGDYTINDNGIPGDNTSVIRDSNGVVITQAPYTLPSAVVTYQSAAGFSGSDTFVFGVTAGTQSDTGTVTVNVTPVDNGR